jgi:hypothetical protein
MAKVESYFGQVQRVSLAFTEKLLSYFDDVQQVARTSPKHLVVALRVALMQEAAWERVTASGGSGSGQSQGLTNGGNPWGLVYKEQVVARMQRSAARQMQPVLLEADRVRPFCQRCHSSCKSALSLHCIAESRAVRVYFGPHLRWSGTLPA